jgi:hypothetical protein
MKQLNYGDQSPMCCLCFETKKTQPSLRFITRDGKAFVCTVCIEEGHDLLQSNNAETPAPAAS